MIVFLFKTINYIWYQLNFMAQKLELQPAQEYTLILTGEEIVKVMALVGEQAYKEVGGMANKIIEQLNQQIKKD
jgi:hypothetical protein